MKPAEVERRDFKGIATRVSALSIDIAIDRPDETIGRIAGTYRHFIRRMDGADRSRSEMEENREPPARRLDPSFGGHDGSISIGRGDA